VGQGKFACTTEHYTEMVMQATEGMLATEAAEVGRGTFSWWSFW
jgi:hypothetical protein